MDSETDAKVTTAAQSETEPYSSSEPESSREMVSQEALDLIEKVAAMQLQMQESQAVASILEYAKQVDEASDELSKNILEINEQLELVNTENQYLKLKLLEMEKNMMERTIAFGEIAQIKDQHVQILASENDRLKATLKMVMERIRAGDFDDIKAAVLVPDPELEKEVAEGTAPSTKIDAKEEESKVAVNEEEK